MDAVAISSKKQQQVLGTNWAVEKEGLLGQHQGTPTNKLLPAQLDGSRWIPKENNSQGKPRLPVPSRLEEAPETKWLVILPLHPVESLSIMPSLQPTYITPRDNNGLCIVYRGEHRIFISVKMALAWYKQSFCFFPKAFTWGNILYMCLWVFSSFLILNQDYEHILHRLIYPFYVKFNWNPFKHIINKRNSLVYYKHPSRNLKCVSSGNNFTGIWIIIKILSEFYHWSLICLKALFFYCSEENSFRCWQYNLGSENKAGKKRFFPDIRQTLNRTAYLYPGKPLEKGGV